MYARLEVPAGEEELLLVPAERLARVGQLNVAWVQGPEGRERRFVRLGEARRAGDMVPVIAGLAPGDVLLPPQ
jgi:hypothetical protein